MDEKQLRELAAKDGGFTVVRQTVWEFLEENDDIADHNVNGELPEYLTGGFTINTKFVALVMRTFNDNPVETTLALMDAWGDYLMRNDDA